MLAAALGAASRKRGKNELISKHEKYTNGVYVPDDMRIHFSSGNIVIFCECNVSEKPFIIAEIEIHFTSIIQNIDFA